MKRFIKKLIEEQIPLKEYYADLLYGTYKHQGRTKNLAEYMICIYKRIYLPDYCHYDEIYKEIQLELQQLSEPDFRMKYKLYLPNYQNYSTDSYAKYELPKLICLEKYSNK